MGKNETAIQVHPAQKDYVNIMPYTLHLWRPLDSNFDVENVKAVLYSLGKTKHTSPHSFVSSYGGTKFVAIYGGNMWPTWNEVCALKLHLFGPNCPAVQYNISSEFDLNDSFLLTLWDATNIPLPPKKLV